MDLLDALEFNQVVIFVRSVNRASGTTDLLECIIDHMQNSTSYCKIVTSHPFVSIVISLKMRGMKSCIRKTDHFCRIERYKQFKDFQARIMVATNIFGKKGSRFTTR